MSTHPRGDVSVTIDGETYLLAPSFKAIAAIEAATGKGLIAILGDVSALHTTTAAVVLHQALRASGFTALSFDAVGQAVLASLVENDMPLIKASVEFLNAYLSKGKAGDAPEKKSAPAKKATG